MKKLFSLLLVLSFLLVYFFVYPEIIWNPDSYSYLRFSEWLQTGVFEGERIPFYLVIRTPGYPFLLYLGSLAAEFPESVWFIHSILGLTSFWFCFRTFSKEVKPIHLFCILSASFLLMREYFLTIMTEWSAFCFLIIYFCLLYRVLNERRLLTSLLLGCCLGTLLLIRPPLIAACLPFLYLLLVKAISTRQLICLIIGTALLIIPWLAYKQQKLGNSSLTDFAGYNLAGVAMTLGEVELAGSQESDFAYAYYYHLNSKRLPTVPADTYRASAEDLDLWVTANTWDTAFKYIYDGGDSIKEGNSLAVKYALRLIRDHPGGYLWFLLQQLYRYLWSLPLLVIAVWAAFRIRLKNKDSVFHYLVVSAVILDVNYFILSSLFTRYIARFQILSASIVLLMTFIALLASSRSEQTHNAP